MAWDVRFHPDMVPEFEALPEGVQEAVLERVGFLREFGPTLGRPHVDRLEGSRISNLKELRVDADGRVWRIAFAFDRQRIGVLLVGGDKQGISKRRFYGALIKLAEERWESWK